MQSIVEPEDEFAEEPLSQNGKICVGDSVTVAR